MKKMRLDVAGLEVTTTEMVNAPESSDNQAAVTVDRTCCTECNWTK